MKFLKLFILFFFTYATATYAQGLNFININADMGLPSNECYRLAQDARGYIWISTEAGLARYSSKEFVLFNTSKGMPSNNVYALDADKTGRLWFATGNWDVGYILNDSVHVLKESFFNETIKSGDVIYKMKYDEQQKSLYVSSHHQTIKIVEENNKFYITALDTSNIPRDYLFVRNNAFTYLGNLWNYKRIPQLDRFLRFPVTLNLNPKDSMVLPIGLQSTFFTEAFTAFLNDREYVVGILDKLVVLNIYNEISSILKLPSQIQCVFSDKKNNLWVSCKKDGVYIFEIGNLAKKPIHLLSGLCISAIIEDIEGGIWASSLEKGVFFCPNKMVNITHPPLNNANGIAFIKVINNHLFLNNETIPLSRVNGDTLTIQQLGKEKTFTVTDIVPTKGGYFITTSLGIYEIDSTLKKNNQLLLPSGVYGGAAGLFSNDLGEDFAYNNASIYNIKNHKLKFCFSSLPKIKHAIFQKNKNIVLVSALGLYLVKLDAYNPSYQSVPSAIKTKAAQSAHDVNKIYQDNLGNFWLPANNDTLNILDENFNLKKAICLNEKNISCRNVLQIGPTVFFVCTNKGLLQVIFKDTTLSNYTLNYFDNSNGLASSDTYNVIQFNNKFYVSTSKGICYFNSPDELQHTIAPNTIINNCTVNDKNINLNTINVFSYQQNNIAFQIDALAFKRVTQRGIFYKYRLEGLEKEFKTATGYVVTYNNLKPGTYKFVAKTFYNNLTEDETPAVYSFTIKAPFWLTWWGIALMILAGISIFFILVLWRVKKIKKNETEKAAIIQTIAEYKFTALKAQMNPHFVFNSINVIQNLILEKDKTEAYNSLGKFARLIRMVLNQSDSVFATIEEELDLINLYVELNQLRIDYPFNFKVDAPAEILSCTIPSLIIQPFIENALWHGVLPLKGKKLGEIMLKICMQPHNILLIQIQDNGIGRKAAALNKSTLLHNSKGIGMITERLKAYQTMNNNCFAELEVIDLVENDLALGTLVQIKIEIAHDAK